MIRFTSIRQILTAAFLSAAAVSPAVAADPIKPATPPTGQAAPGSAPPPTVQAETPKAGGFAFGTYRTMSAAEAKTRVEGYLKAAGKHDEKKLKEIWDKEDRSVLDRTVSSIALALPEAEALLADVRKANAVAPTELPALLKNDQLDPFVRSNLAAAYSKALASKRIYEETLAAAALAKTEELVDPASFFFFKAVAEHGVAGTDKTLKQKNREAAVTTILKLLDDVIDTPDRYRMVATLMFFDIQGWSRDPKDLSNIGKLMDNSGRRLDLARGDDTTQKIQKDIIFRLDEKIKELENQSGGGGGGGGGPPNGGSCPGGGGGGEGGKNPSGGPAGQSSLPNAGANAGKVNEVKLRELAGVWGKLPASERAKAVQEITRDLPPKYRDMIEEYFKSLSRMNGLDK